MYMCVCAFWKIVIFSESYALSTYGDGGVIKSIWIYRKRAESRAQVNIVYK